MTVLSTKNLVFSYPDSPAIHFRDFEIEEGGFVCIKGDMGSGKTTLAKLLSGLEKPSGGAVLYRGKNIWESRASRKAFSGKVALLFQFSSDQLFEKTVLEDVMFGPLNMGLKREEAKKAAEEVLTAAGVDRNLWEMDPFLLSGGQKKLVSLAGVLAIKPEVLILDEVTSALDDKTKMRVLGLLDSLRSSGVAVVLITHDSDINGGIYEVGNDK